MIEGHLSIKEIAEKWGVTRKREQTLCSQGGFLGLRDSGMCGRYLRMLKDWKMVG